MKYFVVIFAFCFVGALAGFAFDRVVTIEELRNQEASNEFADANLAQPQDQLAHQYVRLRRNPRPVHCVPHCQTICTPHCSTTCTNICT